MKKDAILSQPFIFMFAVIVAAFVLIFGFRSVLNLQKVSESVEVTKFVSGLRRDVETYSFLDAGSSKRIDITFPSKVEAICFKHANENDIGLSYIDQESLDLMALTNSNFFVIPLDSFTNAHFSIKNLGNPEDNNLKNKIQCFKNSNAVASSFMIVSHGNFVTVENSR